MLITVKLLLKALKGIDKVTFTLRLSKSRGYFSDPMISRDASAQNIFSKKSKCHIAHGNTLASENVYNGSDGGAGEC